MRLTSIMSILVLVILLISCETKEELTNQINVPEGFLLYKNSDVKISVAYPAEWEVDSSNPQAVVIFYAPYENELDVLSENVVIGIQPILKRTTVKDYEMIILQTLNKVVKDFKLQESSPYKIGNLDARKLVFTGQTEGKPTRWMQVFTIKENNVYLFSYTAHPDTYSVYETTINKMLKSFYVE